MIDAILKVYDKIITKRLTKWWTSDEEQIGNKPIPCTDHILSLHILVNISKTSKKKLYILFVDFSKAYDRVSRSKLMAQLKSSGCGRIMLRAILLMYRLTKLLYKDTIIETNTGVKQGSPSSGFLFTFFINPLVRSLKQLGADNFLNDLHALLMMDDSVIMATSKEKFLQKIEVLMQFCEDQGMVVNELKTQFMVINHTEADKLDILARPDLIIKYTNKYVYLGAYITDDGNMLSVMREQAIIKNPHHLKFQAFTKKNSNAPFYIKRQVFMACILTTLLYSCEVWLTNSAEKHIRKIYLSCIRALLGVRTSTDVDLCLHETRMPSIEALVYDIQRKYLTNVTTNQERHTLLLKVMEMGRNVRMRSGHLTKCRIMRYIDKIVADNDCQRLIKDMDDRRARIALSTKTKTSLYKLWNPSLIVHDVYVTRKNFPEHWREAWTRFRLGSTNLPCEKERWSNNIHNTEREPVCICGMVQTEPHILLECAERIAECDDLKELFSSNNQRNTMKVIYDTLQKYEST